MSCEESTSGWKKRKEIREIIVVWDNFNLDDIMPKGFLEITKDRKMVVKSWVPRVAVLRHQYQRQTHASTIYQKDQSETRKQGIHIRKDIQ